MHCDNLSFDIELVLFGVAENIKTDEGLDFIILFGKFYIYKCRINKTKPEVRNFLRELNMKFKIEKHAAYLNMNYHVFQRIWFPYMGLVEM